MATRFGRIRAAAATLMLGAAPAAASVPKTYLSQARVGDLCWQNSTTAEGALDCWLARAHPDIAAAMLYFDATYNDSSGWKTWPVPVKDDLRLYFEQMVVWYHDGMPANNYPKPFPAPVPNVFPEDPVYGFRMTQATGRAVYLSQTANSLAAELTAVFPWSISSYTATDLSTLLSMNGYLMYISKGPKPGYVFFDGVSSPATPGYTLEFFKTNNLLGPSATDTLGRLFVWEKQLTHYFYTPDEPYPDPNIWSYFWGAGTPPIPASAIVEGTTYSKDFTEFGHFTAGCGGTEVFMKTVLRAVNIPVETHFPVCQHATPWFPTVGLALTHGDDPYDRIGWVSPFQGFQTPVGAEYFVTINEYNQLFPANQSWDECDAKVGIRPVDIGIHYGSDYLMTLYCDDLAANASHAGGKVYKYLKTFYPLQTLENLGTWTTLDAKVKATGFCALIK